MSKYLSGLENDCIIIHNNINKKIINLEININKMYAKNLIAYYAYNK